MRPHTKLSISDLTRAWEHYDRRIDSLDAVRSAAFHTGEAEVSGVPLRREELVKRRAHVENLLDKSLEYHS